MNTYGDVIAEAEAAISDGSMSAGWLRAKAFRLGLGGMRPIDCTLLQIFDDCIAEMERREALRDRGLAILGCPLPWPSRGEVKA